MNCQDVAKYSPLYLDNEFDPRERAEMDSHVAHCSDCRTMLEAEQDFRKTLRQKLAPTEAPQYLRQRITREIEMLSRQSEAQSRRDYLWGWARAVPLIAAAVVVVVLVWPQDGTVPSPDVAEPVTASFESRPSTPIRPEIAPGMQATSVSYNPRLKAVRSVPKETLLSSLTRFQRLPTDVRGSERDILSYMQQRIPFRLSAPLRTSAVVKLVGARQVVLAGAPAVLFVYSVRGERVSVLQQPATGAPRGATQLQRRGTLTVGVFDRGGMTNTVVSTLNPAELGTVLMRR